MSKINETIGNVIAIRDLTDAELDGVNGGFFISALREVLAANAAGAGSGLGQTLGQPSSGIFDMFM